MKFKISIILTVNLLCSASELNVSADVNKMNDTDLLSYVRSIMVTGQPILPENEKQLKIILDRESLPSTILFDRIQYLLSMPKDDTTYTKIFNNIIHIIHNPQSTEKDIESALKRKKIVQPMIPAKEKLMLGISFFDKKYFKEALTLLELGRLNCNEVSKLTAKSEFLLGLMYFNGHAKIKNYSKALIYLNKAINNIHLPERFLEISYKILLDIYYNSRELDKYLQILHKLYKVNKQLDIKKIFYQIEDILIKDENANTKSITRILELLFQFANIREFSTETERLKSNIKKQLGYIYKNFDCNIHRALELFNFVINNPHAQSNTRNSALFHMAHIYFNQGNLQTANKFLIQTNIEELSAINKAIALQIKDDIKNQKQNIEEEEEEEKKEKEETIKKRKL